MDLWADRRQGALVTGVMALLYAASVGLTTRAERAAATGLTNSLEGKEARFGIVPSVVFGAATTGTSTGAVNSAHESYSALGGGLLMLNRQLGEASPGGLGTGLYGVLVMVVITVFSTSPADRPERPQRLLWDASPDEHQSTHLL